MTSFSKNKFNELIYLKALFWQFKDKVSGFLCELNLYILY